MKFILEKLKELDLFSIFASEKEKILKVDSNLLGNLKNKITIYLDLYKSKTDSNGFIDTLHCDSLLWTSLLGSVLPEGINILAARKCDKSWVRRPLVDGIDTCYGQGNSSSSISRDMLLGLMWYIWRNKHLDLATDLWEFGSKNNWIMGEGNLGATLFSFNNRNTLAHLIYKLGGKNHSFYKSLPLILGFNVGYAAHLDILTLLLRAELIGKIEYPNLIKYHFERSPNNALFSYAHAKYIDGDLNPCVKSLLNPDWFPSYRLPTNRDRDESWLWQRDYGDDWMPSMFNNIVEFHGCDFLFISLNILRNKLIEV